MSRVAALSWPRPLQGRAPRSEPSTRSSADDSVLWRKGQNGEATAMVETLASSSSRISEPHFGHWGEVQTTSAGNRLADQCSNAAMRRKGEGSPILGHSASDLASFWRQSIMNDHTGDEWLK